MHGTPILDRIAPGRYESSHFLTGYEVQNHFFCQMMTVNSVDYDETLFRVGIDTVLDDVKRLTAKNSVYIAHSQGRCVGWQPWGNNIMAIVAVELGGMP